MPPLIPHPSLPRWIEHSWSWTQTRPEKINEDNSDDDENPITNNECHACNRSGIPFFHSTRCGPTNQPNWEASASSNLLLTQSKVDLRINPTGTRHASSGLFGPVLDPRSKRVQRWNKIFLIARGISLVIDPFFFYLLSFSGGKAGVPCVYVDATMAWIVTILRTCVDAVHLIQMWLQFRLGYVSNESLVTGAGKLVWDSRAIADNYMRSLHGFWLDVFVILPNLQAVSWLVIPYLITKERSEQPMTILLVTFLFQFIPKVYHIICLTGKMRRVTGYIFGSIWWGFSLNVIGYLVACHAVGAIWYILALQRVATCLRHQCERSVHCNLPLSCSKNPFVGNSTMISNSCLDTEGPFPYGNYIPAISIMTTNSMSARILYPIFWGVLNLSCWGNALTPTSNLVEVLYSIIVVVIGLLFFTLSVGNFQVFLSVLLGKGKKMQLNRRYVERWMNRRQLPHCLRRRVRHFERQTWTTFGGDTEMEWIEDLPEGLRRDIKRYLCLDLIKKVPLFHNLDNLTLDNICDRIKPLIFSRDEKLIREGEPVQRMIFIMRGRVKRIQNLWKGTVATNVLEPSSFLGDELLSWCLRRPFMDRLPASTATFTCMETIEAYGLDADQLKYITDHFRQNFVNNRLKRITRYHSSNWRTWAAVNIQLAWRRYKMRTRGLVISPSTNVGNRLRKYASMFWSLRPHDHLE